MTSPGGQEAIYGGSVQGVRCVGRDVVSEQADGPVRTKLVPPVLRDDVILRERLIEALHAVILMHRLALISAPAGYGKATFLATLLEGWSYRRRPGSSLGRAAGRGAPPDRLE